MITFREIDKSNYMDCICLQVADEQKGFVADNAQSSGEARFEEDCTPAPSMPTA